MFIAGVLRPIMAAQAPGNPGHPSESGKYAAAAISEPTSRSDGSHTAADASTGHDGQSESISTWLCYAPTTTTWAGYGSANATPAIAKPTPGAER